MGQDICQITIIDQQRVSAAEQAMPEEKHLVECATTFKLLGDPTRLKILQALSTTELCVCDLAAVLDSSISAVSHQLRLLRARGVVRYRKEGKVVHYTLDDQHIEHLLADMLNHVRHCG